MCTHNQCFGAKKEIYCNFSSENVHFYSREILQYIAWACLRNVHWSVSMKLRIVLYLVPMLVQKQVA